MFSLKPAESNRMLGLEVRWPLPRQQKPIIVAIHID
jgi:hypothetical protein